MDDLEQYTPFVPHTNVDRLIAVAKKHRLGVYVSLKDHQKGKPFIHLIRRGNTIASFFYESEGIEWLEVSK